MNSTGNVGALPRRRAEDRLAAAPEEFLLRGINLRSVTDESAAVVTVEEAEARERWLRIWKRNQLPERMLAFFDDLSMATDEEAVCRVLAEHAVRIVGGHRAAVHLAGRGTMVCTDEGGQILCLWDAGVELEPRESSGLYVGPDPIEPQATAAGWEIGDELGLWACVPMGSRGVVMVAERRCERIFDGDDWAVLEALADHGVRALQRVRQLAEARDLSLTDPLTGALNRRAMELVLRQGWGGAERGDGLAIMFLDLDDFKRVNDTSGHAAGDQILQIAAESLRAEARGADAVIRYGGDEFLVVMPRTDAAGARALAARVRRRLDGWIGVTEGIAVHHRELTSPEAMIQAADEALYRNKALRRPPTSLAAVSA